MPDILVRNVSEQTARRLKAKAEEHGRSLQAEAKAILERAGEQPTAADFKKIMGKWRKRFAGRTFSDSAELIREDRDGR